MHRLVPISALVVAGLTVSAPALAQEVQVTVSSGDSVLQTPTAHDHWEIEIHGAFLWTYTGPGVGGGARLNVPILASGFGNSINNSFGISVGADGVFGFNYGGFFGLMFHADAQWNVYFTEKLSAFVELGFAPQINIYLSSCTVLCSRDVFVPWVDFAVGGRYHFGGGNGYPTLIARVGVSGITVGVSF